MAAKQTTFISKTACRKCGGFERFKKSDKCVSCKRATYVKDRASRRLRDILRRDYSVIRYFVCDLLLFEQSKDKTGRPIGLDYGTILAYVKKKFPLVVYPGPHKGKPSAMRVDDLITIACDLNSGGKRLPIRPRRRPKKGTDNGKTKKRRRPPQRR